MVVKAAVPEAALSEAGFKMLNEAAVVVSPRFLQSLLKLFAARKCFRECIRAWDLFEPSPDQVPFVSMMLAKKGAAWW